MFGLENQNASRYGCVELAFLLGNSVSNLPIWKNIFVLMKTIIENARMKLMFYLTMTVILNAATVQHKSFVTMQPCIPFILKLHNKSKIH